jgi:hypothetical protein
VSVGEHEVAKATKNYPKLVKVAAGKWLRGYKDRNGGRTKRALLAAEAAKSKKQRRTIIDTDEETNISDAGFETNTNDNDPEELASSRPQTPIL